MLMGKRARITKRKKTKRTAQPRSTTAKKKIAKVTTKKKASKKKVEKPWQHVNRLQLAKLLGVHPDTVSDYSRDGMPVITRGGRGRESSYDAVECLKWWRQRLGKNKKEAAQTWTYETQAQLNELKIAVQEGELLPRDKILLAGQQQVKSWTAKIRVLPRQMVQAGLISGDLEQRVADLLRALLSEISSWKTMKDAKKRRVAKKT